MEWLQLWKFHLNPPQELPGRTPEVIERYQQHRENLASKGQTLTDFILTSVFDQEALNRGWTFVENDFPYRLAPGIQHFVFWISPQNRLSTDQKLEQLNLELIRRGYSLDRVVYYQNLPHLQSIPCIEHYQVFISS